MDPSDLSLNERRPGVSRAGGPLRKIAIGSGLFLMICVLAVFGYVAAGWKWDDAIYMVVITIFGVGYGEVRPIESSSLRVLTIAVIVAGYAAVIYTIGGFMQMLIDGELQKALGARRMTKEIERLQGHTIVCGMGRMGAILARELETHSAGFVVIDQDVQRVQAAIGQGYFAIHGDASEESVLEEAGIRRAAVLATVLSNDATNVFVSVTAREMNAQLTIIARGENPRTEKKLRGCGANQVVLPTAIGAQKLAEMIMRPSAERLLEQLAQQSEMKLELSRIGLQFDELVVEEGSPLVGKRLSDIELRCNHGFLIVGIRSAGGVIALNPPAETLLEAGNAVIVLSRDRDLVQLAERFSANPQSLTYRGVTIDRR